MWPYKTVLHANIMFGEPALAFGVLLAAAAFFLWRKHELFEDLREGNRISEHAIAQIAAVLRPVSVWIFATGLMMASLTVAISYYQLGKAPPQEPISGLFSQSWIETAFLSVVWGLTSAQRPRSARRFAGGDRFRCRASDCAPMTLHIRIGWSRRGGMPMAAPGAMPLTPTFTGVRRPGDGWHVTGVSANERRHRRVGLEQ